MQEENILVFCGYHWKIKESGEGRVGPGPNHFSSSPEVVWVDQHHYLHLAIKHLDGRYSCSELILQEHTGYGLYTVVTSSNVDHLDPKAVLGLFTYQSDDKEIDI